SGPQCQYGAESPSLKEKGCRPGAKSPSLKRGVGYVNQFQARTIPTTESRGLKIGIRLQSRG
ncbi:MAG: hypothetical protein JXA49_07530, partial [Actinobacteria bacterium]|nr:hypothetical protein [Actinomycetota bacterium]